MRQITAMILLAVVILLAGEAHVAGQEQPLRDLMRTQWESYKEGLKEYQFRQTKSQYDLVSGKQRVNLMTVEHRHRGPWKLFVLESKEGRSSVVAINGHYAFSLEKEKVASPWRVGEIDLDLSDGVQLQGMGESQHTEDFTYRYSPYILGESGFLPTLLKRPGFSVTKTEPAGIPEEGFMKVWFKVVADEISAKQTTTVPIEGTGWLLLDPKCYWCIREFELPFYSPRFPIFRAIAKYKYDMARSNYPLLKQIDIAFYKAEFSETPERRTIIDYVIEKRVPTEKEFRLSGFGFPEPMGTPPLQSGTRWYVWMSLAAAGSLCLALLYVILKRRCLSSQPVNK